MGDSGGAKADDYGLSHVWHASALPPRRSHRTSAGLLPRRICRELQSWAPERSCRRSEESQRALLGSGQSPMCASQHLGSLVLAVLFVAPGLPQQRSLAWTEFRADKVSGIIVKVRGPARTPMRSASWSTCPLARSASGGNSDGDRSQGSVTNSARPIGGADNPPLTNEPEIPIRARANRNAIGWADPVTAAISLPTPVQPTGARHPS